MNEVVDYELKVRTSLENSQNKQESMEVEEPVNDALILSKRRTSRNKSSKINSVN
jgi:hypothetical protein